MIRVGILPAPELASHLTRTAFLLEGSCPGFTCSVWSPDSEFDLVLTEREELPGRRNYRKVVYSRPDAKLMFPYEWTTFAGNILSRWRMFQRRRTYVPFLRSVDAVLCASRAQAEAFATVAAHVYHEPDALVRRNLLKNSFSWSRQPELLLGLESSGLNVHSILLNRAFVEAVKDSPGVRLRIVIDDNASARSIWKVKGFHTSLRLAFGAQAEVIPWTESGFCDLLREVDALCVPIDEGCAYARAKPSNRPAIGLANHLPTLASPIPAYVEDLGSYSGMAFARSRAEWQSAFSVLESAKRAGKTMDIAADEVRSRFSPAEMKKFYARMFREVLET